MPLNEIITQTDRVRGLRQSRPPPLASWAIPIAFIGMAVARLVQVRTLAHRHCVSLGEIVDLARLTGSNRLGRIFAGYEVAIIEFMISAGVELVYAVLIVLMLLAWRSNSQTQSRVWKYLQELENREHRRNP